MMSLMDHTPGQPARRRLSGARVVDLPLPMTVAMITRTLARMLGLDDRGGHRAR
jgi:alpha-D-ribose 1-methylphosphonate 5-triphosphate diphosphatase PhnM